MKIYFLRHGDAGDPQAWRGDDAARPLSERGRELTALEGRALAALRLKLDTLLTSPLLRARQTAELVAKPLKMEVRDDARIVDLDSRKLQSILRDHHDADAIMLVGHEPSMSETISRVIGGGAIDLKKGGLACFELDADLLQGRLLWLIPPKVLLER